MKIYGDGIHDDYAGIQELLDSGISTIYLPTPEKFYVISKTLMIHSNQKLKLDTTTRITLKKDSNCAMLKNADLDTDEGNENVYVEGGIWDMNHNEQWPNPFHYPTPVDGLITDDEYLQKKYGWSRDIKRLRPVYTGHCFMFAHIKFFHFTNITIKNPVVFGVQMAYVEFFTIDDIRFDYTEGSPKLWNLDGIHLEGGCRFGKISNLKGVCHDDLLAITSDDCVYGPIDNIEVDGIFAENCHSAVRFLSRGTPIKNITVRNIYGTYYVYCIVMSRYIETVETRGVMENILVENVFASLCPGTVDVKGNYEPMITIHQNMDLKNLIFKNICREETHCFLPTIGVKEGTVIDGFVLDGLYQRATGGKKLIALDNKGEIKNSEIKNIREDF